jgi:hypothetical protein
MTCCRNAGWRSAAPCRGIEVLLPAHCIGLAEQRHQFLIQVFGPGQTKGVDIGVVEIYD